MAATDALEQFDYFVDRTTAHQCRNALQIAMTSTKHLEVHNLSVFDFKFHQTATNALGYILIFHSLKKLKTPKLAEFGVGGCPEQDSNLHVSQHSHLKRARLPFRHLGLDKL